MSRFAQSVGVLALFVLFGAMATPVVAERHTVGSVGATIPGEDWERRTLSESFGPDQFLRADREYFMIVIEDFDLLVERADFLGILDRFASGITARGSALTIDGDVDYTRGEEFTRATRRLSGTVGGANLAYQLDLVSAGDGRSYLFMCWAPLSEADALREQMDVTLEGFELPGPDSEWGQTTVPSKHTFDFDGWTVELTFRDSVFSEATSKPGERYSFAADNGNIGIHLFVETLQGKPDDVMERILAAAADGEEYEELARSDVETEFGSGQQVLLRLGGEPPSDVATAVIGLGDDRWVDLRMVSSGPVGHREYLWDGLLGSLRVTAPPELDAFPVVVVPEEADTEYLNPSAHRLLEESYRLGGPLSEVVAVLEGGEILVRESQRLTLVPSASPELSSVEVLYEADRFIAGAVVPWGDRVLLIPRDGEASLVVDGALEPAGFDAQVGAAAGESLVLARNGARTPLLGFVDLPRVGPTTVSLRNADGDEHTIFEVDEEDVTVLGYRPSGHILIATIPRTGLSAAEERPSARLVLTRAGGGRSKEIARWETVTRIEAAPEGWLVSGTPADQAKGIYRVADDGAAELLVSGSATGFFVDDGELTFATDKCLDVDEETFGRCVYRADLDAVQELGPMFQPFTTQILNRIAARSRPDLETGLREAFPADRKAIAEFVATADESARELTGTEIPLSAAGVDDLLADHYYDWELSDGGVLLLSVLLAESMLREGAVWEPAAEPARQGSSSGDWEIENPFAVGLHPVSVVRGTLYEDEGWYRPMESIAERAGGRTVVLGLDPEAIGRRVRAAELPELAAHLQGERVGQLAAVLEARPENFHLRKVVYRHLAAQGSHAQLVELAGRFAAREDAEGVDLLSWMAGRLAADLSPEEATAAVADLRDAIERAPGEAGLYLLLGSAYERTAEDDRADLAGACYRKARDTVDWGPLKTEAEEALARLGADE